MNVVRYLPFALALHSPAVLSDLGGDPNSSSSLGYIPGSAIRGAVARRIGDPDEDASRRETFDRLILSGSVRYLNAYPIAGSERAFPVPASLRVEKDKPAEAHDLSAVDEWPDEQLIPPESRFLTLGDDLRAARVYLEGTIHNQRDRERGRAWKDANGREVGAIFHYESIATGSRFEGVILIEGDSEEFVDSLERDITRQLTGRLLLGRSRRSEYGADARVEFGKSRLRELAGDAASVAARTPFRCVLLSRYVGRDAITGQHDPRALEHEVIAALGGGVNVTQRYLVFAVTGGYNRKWRLELPQAVALEAGSVLVLESERPITAETIRTVEANGFGERLTEGFGRVAFLEIATPLLKPPLDEEAPPQPAEEPPALIRDIERRLARSDVESAIDRHATRLAKATRIPTSALLGRIRTPLRKGSDGLDEISRWLDADSENLLKEPARTALDRCRLESGETLADWLRVAAATPLPRELFAKIEHRNYITTGSTAETLRHIREDPAMRIRLIDTTLAMLIRRNKLGT